MSDQMVFNFFNFLNKRKKKIIFIIILIFLVYLIILYIYKSRSNVFSPNIIFYKKKPIKGKEIKTLTNIDLFPHGNVGNKYVYSYHFFIYIFNWKYKYGSVKTVFIKGDEDDSSPGFYLLPTINDGYFTLNTDEGLTKFRVKNIDINKWCHIGIVVNNQEVDIYYNGLIQSNNVIETLSLINSDPIIFGHNKGFNGLIYKFGYSSKALTPKEMYAFSKSNVPLYLDI